MNNEGMTDFQLKYLNSIYLYIRKILRSVPEEEREKLEEEIDKILSYNINSK